MTEGPPHEQGAELREPRSKAGSPRNGVGGHQLWEIIGSEACLIMESARVWILEKVGGLKQNCKIFILPIKDSQT